MLNRRHLFGASAAVAVAALPVASQAISVDPWDAKIDALDALDPRLGGAARDARAAGWQVSELKLVWLGEDQGPFLQFQRKFNEQFDGASFPRGSN